MIWKKKKSEVQNVKNLRCAYQNCGEETCNILAENMKNSTFSLFLCQLSHL